MSDLTLSRADARRVEQLVIEIERMTSEIRTKSIIYISLVRISLVTSTTNHVTRYGEKYSQYIGKTLVIFPNKYKPV